MQLNLSAQTLGKYELRELLGEGGMGAVYRAYDHNLKREVAVKILNLAKNDTALRARFIREAETAASLEHNHIVRIYDYGVERDINYIVMQHLTGGALSDRMKQASEEGRPRASLPEVALLLDQLASALDYAHAQGVIHRDIKPQNVMFNNQGQAFIVDFGIAKLLTGATNMTGTGMAMGTPSYMSPEQWTTDNIVPASDQYALAVMTYQLIAGRLPFEADTPMRVMYRHLNDQPTPLSTFRPDIPADLLLVMERALSKDPEQRFPNCTQFAQAFSSAVSAVPVGKTEFFTFKLARPRSSEVPYTPTPNQPAYMPPTPAGNLSLPVIPLTQQPKSGLSRTILLGGLGALIVLGILAVLLFGNRGPSESDLRLTEVNGTLIAAGLATGRVETRVAGLELIETETPEPTNTTEPTATFTDEPSPTASNTASPTSTDAPTLTTTRTPSHTPTDTATASATPTSSATNTETATASNTPTNTHTPSATNTATFTASVTFTPTPTATVTFIAASVICQGSGLQEECDVYVSFTGAPLRTAPNTTSDITSRLQRGDLVNVVDRSDNLWWQVSFNGTMGWISRNFLTNKNPGQSQSAAPASATCPANALQVGCDAYVSLTNAPLRTDPSATSEIITRLQRGDHITILGGPDGTWWQVSVNGRTGWVAVSFLTSKNPGQPQSAAPVTCQGDTVKVGCEAYVSLTNAPLRTAPSATSEIITRLQRGDQVTIRGGPDGTWWQVSFNGRTGWVAISFLTSKNPGQPQSVAPVTCQEDALQVSCEAYVSLTNAPLRTDPSATSEIIIRLQRGDQVTILGGPDGTWWQVSFNGRTGWVAVSFLTSKNPGQPQSVAPVTCEEDTLQIGCDAYVSFAGAPLRTAPTVESDTIARLQRGDLVEVVAGPENLWWQVSFNGATGWVSSNFLTAHEITIASRPVATLEPTVQTTTSRHIITLPGDFQSEIGCESDWMPECTVSQMTDPDNDRVYVFSTDQISTGDWEVKVALNYSWEVNYGVDGVRDGLNIPFSVPETGDVVTFAFDTRTRLLEIEVRSQ